MLEFFNKIPVDKIYEDLFQPGFKKAGEAFEIIMGLGPTILLPVQFLTEAGKLSFKAKLNKWEKKLETVDQAEIHHVPASIGIPLLEKLIYLDQEELSELFLNLLTKASTTQTIGLVHPSFVNVLNNISSDEAKILFHYKNTERIPLIDFYVIRYKEDIPEPNHLETKGGKTRDQILEQINYTFQDKEETQIKAAWDLSGIEFIVPIDFPDNIGVYIENLVRLGIFQYERGQYYISDEDIYNKLENELYQSTISNIKEIFTDPESELLKQYKFRSEIKKSNLVFTEFGKLFIKACLKEIKED